MYCFAYFVTAYLPAYVFEDDKPALERLATGAGWHLLLYVIGVDSGSEAGWWISVPAALLEVHNKHRNGMSTAELCLRIISSILLLGGCRIMVWLCALAKPMLGWFIMMATGIAKSMLGWLIVATGMPTFASLAEWADWSYRGVGEEAEAEHLPIDQQARFELMLKSLVFATVSASCGFFFFFVKGRILPSTKSAEDKLTKTPSDKLIKTPSDKLTKTPSGIDKERSQMLTGSSISQPLSVVLFVVPAAVLEYCHQRQLSYPFLFDALTYDELRRVILSPYLVFPLLGAVLEGISLSATHPVSFRTAGMNARSAVSGILISGYAGTFEELACRWLCQPLFMAFVDVWVGMFSFLPFDWLLQLFGLRLSLPVALYPLEALGGILSLLTLGKLDAAIAIVPKDRAYRYGVYLAELFFALAHCHQGPLGVLIKPLGSVVERRFLYKYGLLAGILAHFIWDAILLAGPQVLWLLCSPLLALVSLLRILVEKSTPAPPAAELLRLKISWETGSTIMEIKKESKPPVASRAQRRS